MVAFGGLPGGQVGLEGGLPGVGVGGEGVQEGGEGGEHVVQDVGCEEGFDGVPVVDEVAVFFGDLVVEPDLGGLADLVA